MPLRVTCTSNATWGLDTDVRVASDGQLEWVVKTDVKWEWECKTGATRDA